MNFYKYSEKIKKVPAFKKEADKIKAEEQAKEIAEVKKEMNRVFQIANRRIQNVRNSGTTSTAVKTLSAEIGGMPERYTVFTNAGLDFKDYNQYMKAKDNYARALRFINNPTSSATGARRFINGIAKQYKMPFDVANAVVDKVMNPQMVNGAVVINNWDSENIRQIVGDVVAEYDKSAGDMSSTEFEEFVSNSVYDLINPKETEIDIWDL